MLLRVYATLPMGLTLFRFGGVQLREAVSIYPYVIRYRVSGNDVVILRVRHTSRRPTNP